MSTTLRSPGRRIRMSWCAAALAVVAMACGADAPTAGAAAGAEGVAVAVAVVEPGVVAAENPAVNPGAEAQASPVIAGTWTWVTPGRNGAPDRKNTLVLQVEDGKLKGKLYALGRDGQPLENEIVGGKIQGDQVEFVVLREFNGGKVGVAYRGRIAGDVIRGKRDFERQGEKVSLDWEARRVTPKP